MKKLTDILKEAGIEPGKLYTDKDKPPFQVNEKKEDLNDKIQVRGLGTWDYKSLTNNIARKLKDLDRRNKKGDHTGIGKNQFGVLMAFWEALSDYEENNQ